MRTGHAALRWLLNFRCPDGQIARWLEELQQYDFKVEHRPGLKHINADALSRRPCVSSGCKYCAKLEDKEELQRKDHGEYISYFTAGTTGTDSDWRWSQEELREAQMWDTDIQPVLQWKEEDET